METYIIIGGICAVLLVGIHFLRSYLSGTKCLLRQRLDGKVIVLICESLDLASIPSIKNFAERLSQREPVIHMLINNAGVMIADFELTEYGFEKNMGVNHLGHFLLTHLLIPRLCAASGAKVINVSSDSHYFSRINIRDLNKPMHGSYYAHSKLAMVIHARELSRRYANQGLTAVSLHPGLVGTELFRQSNIYNAS
ncbi:unnamed protein product [Echinostoma caproni]|uniref:Short-chain dehydrogenase n=1 Tax=Echinostoma caproni TaxID=27848 RepID=A0A183BCR2_9TREM|nr:unnamed protein product [Echinostoma caproni]